MIALLCGTVAWCGDGVVVIDVSGVGFEIHMTDRAIRELSGVAGAVRVHTHLAVRDGEPFLYGFLSRSEVELFRMLISVTRVGPVLALTILSQISIPEFVGAILAEDAKVLTGISGIGEKSAKRLILELGDKMKKKAAGLCAGLPPGGDPVRRDAERALVALGFSQKESALAVEAVQRERVPPDVSSLVRAALSTLRER